MSINSTYIGPFGALGLLAETYKPREARYGKAEGLAHIDVALLGYVGVYKGI